MTGLHPASSRPIAAVVMAGGLGTRMRSELPKHLHPLLGRRMVDWVIAAGKEAGADPLVVVASPTTASAMAQDGLTVAVQANPLGTGDAVRSARTPLNGVGDVLVLSGDTPLLTAELLRGLITCHRLTGAAATILSARPDDPRQYGRVVRDQDGSVLRIVEAADASEEERAIGEVNTSIYVFVAAKLWPALERLTPQNKQGELYLTDAIEILVAGGERVSAHVAPDAQQTDGVNTPRELQAAERRLRERNWILES